MNKGKLSQIVTGFFLLILGVSACSEKKVETQKQHVVFILVDDLGWTDLGYSGSSFYESPHIDALSETSIQFSQAYSAGSVCSPSRAAIMSGKHPAHVNITDWIPGHDPKDQALLGPQDLHELPLAEESLVEVLQQAGYSTFFAGKWHLGDEGYFPEDQGFDINIGGHHKGSPPGGYYSPYKNPKLSNGPDGEYLPDRLTDESIQYLDGVGDKPFFLFLSYYTVHTPIQASKRHLEKFEKKLQLIKHKKQDPRPEGNGMTRMDQFHPAYASMVYAMDENVGRLIQALKDRGLYEETTIIFTSDNGGLSTLDKKRKNPAPTSVLPLRGGKGWLYEGGIRVPLLIKPAYYTAQNQVSDVPVIGYDFYPTILSLLNIDPPQNQQLDGIDLSPVLTGKGKLERNTLYWHYPHYHGSGWTPGAAIREGDWKLVELYESHTLELYDLAVDISEANNLAEQFPDKVKMLKEKLDALQISMKAQMPQKQ